MIITKLVVKIFIMTVIIVKFDNNNNNDIIK